MPYLFDPPAPFAIPVDGERAAYPVRRIFCVGRNYADHAAEMGVEVDREAPFYFTKSPANAILSGAEVPYPPGTENYHHEMELYLAIGAPLFQAAPEAAQGAVYGYGCALDMTRRDLQIRERKKQRPWDLGKDVENAAVFAPMVTAQRMGAIGPQQISLSLNGGRAQQAHLSDMIWSVPEIVSHLSGYYHLDQGDVILTGTPAGVGPVSPGDRITGEIDGCPLVSLDLENRA